LFLLFINFLVFFFTFFTNTKFAETKKRELGE
jgi:hypothetical protein